MSDRPILVFDVNETILDLSALEPTFARLFGSDHALRRWFAELIIASQALTLAGSYVPFGELGAATLRKIGRIMGVAISDADVEAVRDRVAAMPPYDEVAGALAMLRDHGFRMVTLTNNPLGTATAQLERGGIAGFFEASFSVDGTANRYKPAPETYALVETALDVAPQRLCMIACHDWDVLGASARGWHSAMIERTGNAVLSAGPQPTIVGPDLADVARQLVTKYPG